MKLLIPLAVAIVALTLPSQADLVLSENGKTQYRVIVDPSASASERAAARELAETLEPITASTFALEESADAAPDRAIFVGPGSTAKRLFPEVPWEQLGAEEIVLKTKGNWLLIAGGRPRGTLYAVARFLQEQCGVRRWTPWASRVPQRPTLRVTDLDVRSRPAFEYREPFWRVAFDSRWAVRNCVNGQSAKIPADWGGSLRYKGFVHTFYPLVPPEKHFSAHPEWFSLVKEQRSTNRAQLCLTNPELRDFVVERVEVWLRESPEAAIISVSQNDWSGSCECEKCRALDDAEGSHSGTMLAFVNYIAEKIEREFPQVAIDTLAYQYTRKPPKTVKPRSNVIVRLCSIECNFREPLDHRSNSSFAEDLRGWSTICQRLYIWDYTTDFAHYVQPHPNWFTLGPNLRFFEQHQVRGVFEQGAYQSYGSEMAELRAWLLAQLLWNPRQDDRALINEFLEGYYGPSSPFIGRYLELMHHASAGHNLTCYSSTQAPFLNFDVLTEAESLWKEAERAVRGDAELLARVRLGHLPLRYVWLARWAELRRQCADMGKTWPLPDAKVEVSDEWLHVADGDPARPWSKVILLSESGLTPQTFLARLRSDPK